MSVQFPIKCEVSVYLTDGKHFATASGPEVSGDVVTKEGALQAIAAAVLVAEKLTNMTGWRLPTPKEFLEKAKKDLTGQRFAVPHQPPEWPGFTAAELDAEVERQRNQEPSEMWADGDEV
jgi:hypothetical protein